LVLLAKLLFSVPSMQIRFVVFDSPPLIRLSQLCARSSNPALWIVPLDSGCGCYWQNRLPVSSSQMQFAMLDSPWLVRLRSPVASTFQFLLRGLSIRMTRFGAIGQIAFTVLFLQMRFAVFDSLSIIHLRFASQSLLRGLSPRMTAAVAIGQWLLPFHLRECRLSFLIHCRSFARETGLHLHFNSNCG
jgi:hypothetical protein